MIIFPAIDISGGKVVRLYKGDYSQMTVYEGSPLDVAKSYEEIGATHLHVVDLDGACVDLVAGDHHRVTVLVSDV